MWSSSRPSRCERPHLAGLAVAKTSAPRCWASWTAAMPTPPAPAWTRTRSPGLQPGQVDEPVVGGEEDRPARRRLLEGPAGGDRAERLAVGDRQRPERARDQPDHPIARRRGRSTSAPTSTTTPAPSLPEHRIAGHLKPRATSDVAEVQPRAPGRRPAPAPAPSGSRGFGAGQQGEALQGAPLGRMRGARAPPAAASAVGLVAQRAGRGAQAPPSRRASWGSALAAKQLRRSQLRRPRCRRVSIRREAAGVLGLGGAQQAPGQRPGQGRGVSSGADRARRPG